MLNKVGGLRSVLGATSKVVGVQWPPVGVSGQETSALGRRLCRGPSELTSTCEHCACKREPLLESGSCRTGHDLRGHFTHPVQRCKGSTVSPLGSRPTPSNAAPLSLRGEFIPPSKASPPLLDISETTTLPNRRYRPSMSPAFSSLCSFPPSPLQHSLQPVPNCLLNVPDSSHPLSKPCCRLPPATTIHTQSQSWRNQRTHLVLPPVSCMTY